MRAAAFAAGIGFGLALLAGGRVRADDWPMYGHDFSHSSSNPLSGINSSNVWALQKVWTFWTGDAVSASPTVVDGVVYVGSWDGNFYALNAAWPYPPKWVFQQVDCQNNSKVLPWPPRCVPSGVTPPPRQNTDGGLITSSAAVAVVDGIKSVFFAGGKTLYRLNADNGSLIWKRVICGNPVPHCDDPISPFHPDPDPTRIFSSPAVADGLVFIGHTVDGVDGYNGGFEAVNASTGKVVWRFDLDPLRPNGLNRGCGNVWSSAAIDTDRGLVFFGTSDCHENATPPYHEAVIALTKAGQLAWIFRPRNSDVCDFDFGASPNIIDLGFARFVGIGGKDGTYYLLRESDGVPAWTRRVVFGGAIGGFFGAAAFDGFHIFSSTAVGDPTRCSSDLRDLPVQEPSMHALNVWNGQALWERILNQSFGATSVSNDAAFAGFVGASPVLSPAVKAYNAWSGNLLRTFNMPGQVNSAATPVGRMLFVTSGNSTDGKGGAVHAFALPWWVR